MFGLLKVLAFPVTGPLVGTRWIAGVLLDEAERTLYDEGAIRQRMAEVERQYKTGEIGGAAFELQHEALLQRLLEAREYHRRKRLGDATEVPVAPAVSHRRTRARGARPRKPTRRSHHG